MSAFNAATQVRLATPVEAEVIAAVLREAFSAHEALYTPAAYAATTPSTEQLQKRWAEGPVWAALRAGQLVGTVAGVPKTEGVYVRSLAIVPQARGQGIGKLLLHELELWAKARGTRRLYLSTTPFLLAAIQLYEQFGFQRTGDGPGELYGTPLFTMEKLLKD